MGTLIVDDSLTDRSRVFKDRADAGRRLASFLANMVKGAEIVLAIPSGGVPVGMEVSDALSLSFDLVISRKLHIPWNAEAGFGAVDPDGSVILNDAMMRRINIDKKIINEQIRKTNYLIENRNTAFRGRRPFPDIKGRKAILVDDGLATGYTMLSAVGFVGKRKPAAVIVAAPTASKATVDKILPLVDTLICLNVRSGYRFAVAEAYEEWHDLTDDEVTALLKGRLR